MRTVIRWAARLYPATWRNRYAAEFDALLEEHLSLFSRSVRRASGRPPIAHDYVY